jgi:hypothetical protein
LNTGLGASGVTDTLSGWIPNASQSSVFMLLLGVMILEARFAIQGRRHRARQTSLSL